MGAWASTWLQMQLLQHRALTWAVPCMQKEVWRMQQGQPIQGSAILQVSEDQDWRFYVVRVKYINLNSVKSVLFTKLESSTSQSFTKIA